MAAVINPCSNHDNYVSRLYDKYHLSMHDIDFVAETLVNSACFIFIDGIKFPVLVARGVAYLIPLHNHCRGQHQPPEARNLLYCLQWQYRNSCADA